MNKIIQIVTLCLVFCMFTSNAYSEDIPKDAESDIVVEKPIVKIISPPTGWKEVED